MNIRRGKLIIVTLLSIVLIYFGNGITITKCCHNRIVNNTNDECCHHKDSNKHGLAKKSCMNVTVVHLAPTTIAKQTGKLMPQIYAIQIPVFLKSLSTKHLLNNNIHNSLHKTIAHAPPKTLLSLICTFII